MNRVSRLNLARAFIFSFLLGVTFTLGISFVLLKYSNNYDKDVIKKISYVRRKSVLRKIKLYLKIKGIKWNI